jgi:dihydrofolate synthase/folylpolyglutamate synthase
VTFDESVKYLLSLGNEVLAMKLGLENIIRLLAALDYPQNNYFKVQVAGTNGKGSTCAFLEAICLSAGIKTGLATSPHLISITERIRIGGRDIGDEDFARFATKIRETSENLVAARELESAPTYFEQVTAIALYAFAEAGVELAILETGLGGRFDATTAANADIAVIARIDYDHQEILGHTLAEIAAEKAAIIRSGSKVVVAPQRPEAAEVIAKVCNEKNIDAVSEITPSVVGIEKEGIFRADFQTAGASYKNARLVLRGRHQVENAGTAILAAELLSGRFTITGENIIDGLRTAVHRGRLEFKDNFLFDGAHNAAGAEALANFLDDFAGHLTTLIFGAMRDKDLGEITRTLFPRASSIILVAPDNPRAVPTSELRKYVPEGMSVLETTVENALDTAYEMTPPGNIICITGSLYLVGEAQKLLNNNRYE